MTITGSTQVSGMRETLRLGTEFWNDSCDLGELTEAVAEGALGATSNPVIVHQALESSPEVWDPVLDRLIEELPDATEVEILWALVSAVGEKAAKILLPVWRETEGRQGYLSMQVSPLFYRSAPRMVEQGERLAATAPNIAVKIPATSPGLVAIEELSSRGIRINATVCFTVAQAVACAEAVERGVSRRSSAGNDVSKLLPTVTLMVGRLDDHLGRVLAGGGATVDPGVVHWAGIAVFKKTYGIFKSRGFRSRLLAAAYRHHLHWTELIGEGVVESIPYKWWRRFNASGIRPRAALSDPVRPEILTGLNSIPDFRKAYDEKGLSPPEFVQYGAAIHTLNQFLEGYDRLLSLVRARLLR
jgi:transaldolase